MAIRPDFEADSLLAALPAKARARRMAPLELVDCLSVSCSVSRAVVQSAGQGLRLNAPVIKDEFTRSPVLHPLLRDTQALITQLSQTAVCDRHPSLTAVVSSASRRH